MDYVVHGILQARILEWAALTLFRRSSQPKDGTQVSCIAGRSFTVWDVREAQEHWRGEPIPSPGDLADPGIKPGSHELLVDSTRQEGWVLKNWCFGTVVLDKTLRVPWTVRRSNQSILKKINPEYSLEGLRLKLQYFGNLMRRVDSLEKKTKPKTKKKPDTGKDWRQEKGAAEDEMVGWHHWLKGHKFEQAPGDSEGQGSLRCSSWGHKEPDITEQQQHSHRWRHSYSLKALNVMLHWQRDSETQNNWGWVISDWILLPTPNPFHHCMNTMYKFLL